MYVPQIKSLDTALRIYYSYPELGNKEIQELFTKCSPATVSRLKQEAKMEMRKRAVLSYSANAVNTDVAYSTWGLDPKDLERRRKKMKELNIEV